MNKEELIAELDSLEKASKASADLFKAARLAISMDQHGPSIDKFSNIDSEIYFAKKSTMHAVEDAMRLLRVVFA